MALALRRYLLKCYGSFADKRIKNPEKSGTFIVDDRDSADVGSDGQLYGYFCMVFATANSDTELNVDLRGNIPRSPGIERRLKAHGLSVDWSRLQPALELKITRGDIALLRELADEFDAIVAPGRRYGTANYKYVCPRTAGSLRRLAGFLDKYSWKKEGFF